MASIFKRKNKKKKDTWRVIVRKKGYPVVCRTFRYKRDAIKWGAETEYKIEMNLFQFEKPKEVTRNLEEECLRLLNQ